MPLGAVLASWSVLQALFVFVAGVAPWHALLVAAGMLAAVLSPAPWVALIGFGLAGFGCATLIPSAFVAASEIPGMREGTGMALLSWLMRLSLLTSPTIGIIVDATSVRMGLIVPVVGGLIAAALASTLSVRKDTP